MLPKSNTHGTLAVEQHLLDQKPCFKTQVGAMQHRLQEATRRGPAEATLLIDVEVANTGIVPGIKVLRHRDTHLDGSLRHVVEDIPSRSRRLHAPLTADSMMFRFAQKMVIEALEHGTDIVPAPPCEPAFPPGSVIRRLAPHRDNRR